MEFQSLKQACCLMPALFCESRRGLSEAEGSAYSSICLAMAQRETGVKFKAPASLDIHKVMDAVFSDQPMFFYVKKEWSYKYSSQDGIFTIEWPFQIAKDEIDLYIKRIDHRIKRLKISDQGNHYERELRVHNTMLDMKLKTGPSDWKDHCIVGPLLENRTVCEGASLLFLLLCGMCGVHCILVSGFAGNSSDKGAHAWNMVRLNRSWAHVDAYWDIVATNQNKSYHYEYFNLSDADMRHDHDWEFENYPACIGATSLRGGRIVINIRSACKNI